MNNIYLVGFNNGEKNVVAKKLQKFLPFQILNLDEAIQRVEVMTIAEIKEKKGEEGYRNAEAQLLAIISKENNQIITCDDGIFGIGKNIEIMKNTGTIIGADSNADIILDFSLSEPDKIASEIVKQLALKGRLN